MAVSIVGAALVALAGPARAAGTPDISATVSSSETLYGQPVDVTMSASNPGTEPYGYNLSFRVVLAEGVSYAGGTGIAPTEIADQPNSGETTLIFSNVSDLSPGSHKELGFDLSYSSTIYDAGDSFPVAVEAFVNEDPRFIPKFDANGEPEGPSESSFTGYSEEEVGALEDTVGTQTLKAIDVNITEPSPEGEILRGVHDHQTVYTVEVTNNGVNPTTGTKLDVYLPAGLEFLGCGGPGMDNTTEAPTNPGSAEEYPGSRAIESSSLEGCVEPESVETEVVDPDGAGAMPEGVYTHVVWPVGTLEDGETKTFLYRAAVPIRANTNTFSGTRPSKESGDQAANLDNNSGAEVVDETALRTYATASGTYQGKTPGPATDAEELLRTAEDWVVRKSGSSGTLAQGAITEWTLTFETSEYKYVDDAVVTDTLPNGLCPLGPENFTGENDSADSECDPVVGEEPSAPYASASENEDGSWTLTWDETTLAKLGQTGVNDKFTITFPTRTRTNYQSNFLPAGPILTYDELSNHVSTTASGFARCTAPGTPDCSTPGPKVDHDGTDGSTIGDESHAEQVAGGPTIEKEVAVTGADCQAATYTTEVPHYHPGDRICWKLRVDFPGALDTSPQAIADYLPAGVTYESGSDEEFGENTVEATLDESGAADGLLTWTVSGAIVPAGAKVFERVFSTIATTPGTPATGDLVGNLMKFSSEDTVGETVPLRDEAEFVLEVPEVDLVKGVEGVVRGGSAVDGPNGPNTDDKPVEADDEVTYRVDVTNSGEQDAVGVEVWDLLPAEYPCTAIAAISNGGECVDASPTDRVVWVLPEVEAGSSQKLTYTATVPSDMGPGRTLANEAGVAQFSGETNLGGLFIYTPADNIDPENEAEPNAPAADDPSNVFTTAASVGKEQATSVTESGNLATQATIGEQVIYTVTATIPEGTALGGTAELTDAVSGAERLAYVSGSATATLNGGELPAGFTLDTSGATPRVIFPAGYANAPGSEDDEAVLSFEMVVTNVAANTRTSSNLTNQATLKWTDPVAGAKSTASNTTSAQVVEPLISQTKTDDVNPDRVDPGDIVTYTVTTSNSTATRVSTAHGVRIVDTVPAGLIPVGTAPGNEPLADGAEIPGSGGAIWDAATRTIAKEVATLAPGADSSFTYRAEVEKPAVAGAVLTNEVESTTASLDSSSAGRRTSGSGYEATAEDTIKIGGASITKSVTPEEATIGESVTYELTVTIPPNVELFDTTVFDVLPEGIEFEKFVSEECVSGCPLANPIDRYPTGHSGETFITWSLGDIPALSEPQVIKFTYAGHVMATTFLGEEVLAGRELVNSARVASHRTDKFEFNEEAVPSFTEFDDVAGPAKATVTVAEPDVSIDKQIKVGTGTFGNGPTAAHSSETLTYHLTVTNSGDSPAYDVEVSDLVDEALTEIDADVELPAGVTVADGWDEGSPNIVWLIDGPIAAGGSVTLTYTAKFVAAGQLHDGQQVPNTAKVPHYFGVPKATRDANPSHTYRDYTDGGEDSTEAVLDFPALTIDKTTGLAGNPDTGDAEVGQEFPWRIVVSNSSATAGVAEVKVQDVLPPNWRYVAGSSTYDGAGGPEPTVTAEAGGDRLEWLVPTLAPEGNLVIAFKAIPEVAAAETPGTGGEANVNTARVTGAEDEAGNIGNEEGPYEAGPDTATATLQVPQLSIEKTPDDGEAVAGEEAEFAVAVENNGTAPARDVVVTDVLPAGISYTAGSATAEPSSGFGETSVNPGPGAGQTTVKWAIADLPVGQKVTITVPVSVAGDAPDGTTLVNSANAFADEVPDPVEDEGSLEVSTEADISIEKTGDPTYTAGNRYTWHLKVENNGPSDAQDVRVRDELPAGALFVSADAPCDEGFADVVDCNLGTVPAGFGETYDVTVEVNPDTIAEPLDNTATVSTTTEDPDPSNDESTFGPEPSPLADVWITKSAEPAAILHNHETTFTIVVHNDGPSVARVVEVEDDLPTGLEYVSVTGTGCSESGGTVTCEIGDLAPGGEVEIEITVRGTENAVYTNVVDVETPTPEPPDHKPNSAEAEVTVGPVAELGIVKEGPANVAADGQLTYTLTVTNNGPDDATGVTIEDTLPAGTAFVSADEGCTEASGAVACLVGNLGETESAQRRITITVPRALADTTIVNSAKVEGEQGDDEPENNEDEAETKVGPSADVSIVKTGPNRVNANGTMSWTLAVSNAGPSTATGVRVSDALPVGVALSSATPTQGSCAAGGAGVECSLGSLTSGGSAQIQVVAHVPPALEGATLVNAAGVTARESDPDPTNNESRTTTTVDPPAPSDYDLSIRKTIDEPQKPALGEVLHYSIEVANRGPATATGVKVTDALPGSVEFVSASIRGGKCSLAASVVTCKLASLAAGTERKASIAVRLMRDGQLRNTATVSAAVADVDSKNNRSTVSAKVTLGPAKLKLSKVRVGKGRVEPGERVRYKIKVSNVGESAAADVVVCDRLPTSMSFAKLKGASLEKGDACWAIEMLPAGGSESFHLAARIAGGFGGGGIRNVAYVKADNAPKRRGVAGVRVESDGAGRGGGVTG